MLGMAIGPLSAFGFAIPSVSLCVEKTGLTEKECQEKMKNFGSMSSEQKMEMKNEIMGDKGNDGSDAGNPNAGTPSVENPKQSVTIMHDGSDAVMARIEKVQKIKTERKEQFSSISEKMAKVTDFLKRKNSDVSDIEKNIDIFEKKCSDVLDSYDAYASSLEGSMGIGSSAVRTVRSEEYVAIARLTGDLMDFYRTTLRESLKSQLTNASD